MLLESDEEVLCRDVPVGRVGRMFLSLEVCFYHRATEEWGDGRVRDIAHDFTLNGVFLELGVQGMIRRHTPRLRTPHQYWPGMDWFDGPRWDVSRMRLATGVALDDLRTLAELSAVYNRAMVIEPGEPAKAVFISRAHERTIRDIAARLNALKPVDK